MATRVISTRLALDGEKEFKKQLSDVNSELRNLDADMKNVTESFKGNANTAEALRAKQKVLTGQIEQQEEKVRALRQALDDAEDAYGDNNKKTDEYYRSLKNAETQLTRFQRELKETNKYLDEAEHSADGAADSIDGFGNAAKGASDKGGGLGSFGSGISDLTGSLSKLKGFVVGGAIVTGLKEVAGAVLDIEESTREYRQIMGTLEVSSQAAGYSAEQTAEAYQRLYGYLGDTQTTATTVANLQAIGLEQDTLMDLVDMTAGAWATYGDSIPIDGLAESINETIQAGKVTGTFADVLNWAGTSEDEFNEKLENAKDATERADIVLQEMARQGLTESAEAWRDVNDDIVAANESQMKFDEAMGELGEALTPAANALRDLGTEALGYVTQMVINATDALRDLKKAWDDFFSGGDDAKSAKFEVDETAYALKQAETYAATSALSDADVVEQGFNRDTLNQVVASAFNGALVAGSNSGPTTVKTVINLDGRQMAEAVSPALREYDKANPEVTSDR